MDYSWTIEVVIWFCFFSSGYKTMTLFLTTVFACIKILPSRLFHYFRMTLSPDDFFARMIGFKYEKLKKSSLEVLRVLLGVE